MIQVWSSECVVSSLSYSVRCCYWKLHVEELSAHDTDRSIMKPNASLHLLMTTKTLVPENSFTMMKWSYLSLATG